MAVAIKLAQTDQERAEVYRFRYRIYVEEMRRLQTYADHDSKQVEEPLDASGIILFATDETEVVGTVRLNVGVDENFGIYDELYNLRKFGLFYPAALSITTKLMVAREYRCSTLPLQLALQCYKHGTALGSCFDTIDCNPHLVAWFKRLGYRQIFPCFDHPEYGNVVPMVLVGYDAEHLRLCGSPFARLASRRQNYRNSVEFFYDTLLRKHAAIQVSV